MPVDKKKPSGLALDATAAPAASGASIEQDSDRVTLSLSSGAKATILLYGATVISWTINDRELLWLSEASALDGSKAVRGGIPLVFPVFGPPRAGTAVEALPQHGFARINKWNLLGRIEDEAGISVDLGLSSDSLDEDTKSKWPHSFGLIYSVKLTADTLETKMVVQNPDPSNSFDFNVLFHTYLRIPDVDKIGVQGLDSLTYRDKTLGGSEHPESAETIKITGETDRVYMNAPDKVTVLSDGAPLFTVTKLGLKDVVLWNPHTSSSKMGDWAPAEGYKNMVCVEAGSVASFQNLEAGAAWEGGVVHKAHL
ncbi:hypothetical protein H072_2170 [Dactylellina haptotyla CBS 200.50]|uniref:Glucose-6-phosphate 1-epimerase n=1 Tax=Dactylellina haptotyla (strain CBS 200.50) TaxID=1284197 RepID=S8ALZ2_DACHA|nr:hypothetical protein H072_2170 [Dactylellina haptotyla CBS 200.50]